MTNEAPPKPIDILMVEDSPTDVLLAREALEDSHLNNRLHVAEHGLEALAFLHQQGAYASAPRPDLILLDLNMPTKNGHEVLAEIKADETLKHIPVVIFTTSKAGPDVLEAYGRHANCYITKPMDFDAFAEAVRSIASFWFSTVTLPPN